MDFTLQHLVTVAEYQTLSLKLEHCITDTFLAKGLNVPSPFPTFSSVLNCSYSHIPVQKAARFQVGSQILGFTYCMLPI